MSRQLLRIIDANLNRCSEGLRVLEDAARFVLNDTQLGQRLRTLRHDLARQTDSIRTDLLSQRDSEYDVGRAYPPFRPSDTSETARETLRLQDLTEVVTSNAKRAEEALRVMEELARLPALSSTLDSGRFAGTRFELYTLERDLVSRISRRDKTDRIHGLYVILDRQFVAKSDELATAKHIISGGTRVVQLRDKSRFDPDGKGDILALAQQLREMCRQAGVLFIVNDHLDIAVAVDADGIHMGQSDLPLPLVRRELPIDKIVGCSVRTLAQASKAEGEGADYIAVGSIFPTNTKTHATVVGLDTLTQVRGAVSIPVVAIGGINRDNIGQVVAAGADAVAVISAVLGQKDVGEAAKTLVAAIDSMRDVCHDQLRS